MDAESFIISAVITIVLLCVAFGTRALMRKHRKKKGTWIVDSDNKKRELFTNIILVLALFSLVVGIVNLIIPKAWHTQPMSIIPSARMSMFQSIIRQYGGNTTGSNVEALINDVNNINNEMQRYPYYDYYIDTYILNNNRLFNVENYPIREASYYTVRLEDINYNGYYDRILIYDNLLDSVKGDDFIAIYEDDTIDSHVYIPIDHMANAKEIDKMIQSIITRNHDESMRNKLIVYYNNQKINPENDNELIHLDSNTSYVVAVEDTNEDGCLDTIFIEDPEMTLPRYFEKHYQNVHVKNIYFYGKPINDYSILESISGIIYMVDYDDDYESVYLELTGGEDQLTLKELMLLGPQFIFDLRFTNAIIFFVICITIGLIGIILYYIIDIGQVKNDDKLIINIESLVYILICIIAYMDCGKNICAFRRV